MKEELKTILKNKRDGRTALAHRTFSEKIAILEGLRERRHSIAASRPPSPRPSSTHAKAHDKDKDISLER